MTHKLKKSNQWVIDWRVLCCRTKREHLLRSYFRDLTKNSKMETHLGVLRLIPAPLYYDPWVMWHWSNFSGYFPKQTALKSQPCCSPLNTAALTQQPCSAERGFTASQRPVGAPPPGPSAGNSPVAKNNSQTDDRLSIRRDHTVHFPFPPLMK